MSVSQERRQHDRFTVDPMYSSVVVSPIRKRSSKPLGARGAAALAPAAGADADAATQSSEGHLYEVSLGGMRFELDEPVPAGARFRAEINLPGCGAPITVDARVVRVYDEVDDPGPRRMVAEFETFAAGARALTVDGRLVAV